MSRIGKQIIAIPDGVQVTISESEIIVKGPKGSLTQSIHPNVSVKKEDNNITVHVAKEDDKNQRALWGLFASVIKNMVIGVTQGFEKKLEVNGVGYKVALSGSKLTLNVGFSHPVDFALPEGITGNVEGNVVTITGIDKQLVGQVAADIRKIRKPEPYKGKGIKYMEETILRKVGKAASKG